MMAVRSLTVKNKEMSAGLSTKTKLIKMTDKRLPIRPRPSLTMTVAAQGKLARPD